MAYSNSIYQSRVINNEELTPSEAIWSPTIQSPNTMKITVQMQATANSVGYSPPSNPTMPFTVSLYNIGYETIADSTPYISKSVSVTGNGNAATISFDTVGISSFKLKVQNTSAFGVYVTVRITMAVVQ